jgi:hypothetical protein
VVFTRIVNFRRANLYFCTSDVHRRWFILSECERWKLEYLYLSMVQFFSLVFKMSATEIVGVGIELISLALIEECRKILETRKKRRPRWWWVKPWIRRREQLGASTHLLVELAAEDSDSYRNHLRMSEAQLNFLLQKVSPLLQKADTFLRPALPANCFYFCSYIVYT